MRRFLTANLSLVWMGIISVAACVRAQEVPAYSVVTVQDHRCLVVDSEDLPSGAPVVLILHGFGTNGDELLSLCEELQIPPCRFVLPDAPLPITRYPSVDHAWYDRFTHSRKDIERSRDYLFAVMSRFSHDSSSPKPRPVVIMGFSQGAVMALEAGLNYKGKITAIVSMSGYMGEPEKTLAHPSALKKTPILLTHGTRDAVVQDEDTQRTLGALRKAGYKPILREFEGGHHLTSTSIELVSVFLQKVLARNH